MIKAALLIQQMENEDNDKRSFVKDDQKHGTVSMLTNIEFERECQFCLVQVLKLLGQVYDESTSLSKLCRLRT